MSRKKLYLLLIIACTTAYVWLGVSYFHYEASTEKGIEVCLFKRITNIPCPSCGTTRAVLSLMQGDLKASILVNPFGIIIMLIMVLSPMWILWDLVMKKDSLFRFYERIESYLRIKWVAIPAIIIVLVNWIWNIYKGL